MAATSSAGRLERWMTMLTVELVSYGFHASRRAFEADVARRRRSNHLAYSYGDVVERSGRTAGELRALLARSAGA